MEKKIETITVKALNKNVITEEEITLNEKNVFRTLPFNTNNVNNERITVLNFLSNALGDYWSKLFNKEN